MFDFSAVIGTGAMLVGWGIFRILYYLTTSKKDREFELLLYKED